jgi:nucleoside triphosphate pyrophosphatase
MGGLILASGSPRRRALLAAAGVAFTVAESGIPEIRHDHERACDYALRMAAAKALNIAARFPATTVLAADTVVECGGEILEKPTDVDDARRMLRMLSGNTHAVVTAFALARDALVIESAPVISRVTFRRLSPDEVEAYLTTGDPFDKAGAYGIQGVAADFIAAVDGSRDNVMGLPVREVLDALKRNGIDPR